MWGLKCVDVYIGEDRDDAEALRSQSQELELAQETMHLVQTNYRAGLVNYLQILIANGQYFQAKIGYLQTLAQRFQDTSHSSLLWVAAGGMSEERGSCHEAVMCRSIWNCRKKQTKYARTGRDVEEAIRACIHIKG